MSSILNVVDVVDIGIVKEKARRDFYNAVSKTFTDKPLIDLFRKLRDWEEAHVKKFQLIRDGLKIEKAHESYPGEMSSYINALVDDRLYREVGPESFKKHIKTPVDAIEYGIVFEKDAILLFIELAQYVRSSHKEVIMQLIEEEKQHMIYLERLKSQQSVS